MFLSELTVVCWLLALQAAEANIRLTANDQRIHTLTTKNFSLTCQYEDKNSLVLSIKLGKVITKGGGENVLKVLISMDANSTIHNFSPSPDVKYTGGKQGKSRVYLSETWERIPTGLGGLYECQVEVIDSVGYMESINRQIQITEEDTVAELVVVVKELQTSVAHSAAAIKELPTSAAHSEATIKELQTSAAHSEATIKELLTSVAHLKKTFKELQTFKAHLEPTTKELQTSLAFLKTTINELQTSVAYSEAAIREWQTSAAHSEAAIKELQTSAAQSEATIKELQTSMHKMQAWKEVTVSANNLLDRAVMKGFYSKRHKNKYYIVYKNEVGRVRYAENFCLTRGGYLAELNDFDEWKFVKSFISSVNYKFHYCYISGRRNLANNTFYWPRIGKVKIPYVNWGDNQPNGQNCLAIYKGFQWRISDVYCNMNQGFVCEMSAI